MFCVSLVNTTMCLNLIGKLNILHLKICIFFFFLFFGLIKIGKNGNISQTNHVLKR
jgi:hypothetical protein